MGLFGKKNRQDQGNQGGGQGGEVSPSDALRQEMGLPVHEEDAAWLQSATAFLDRYFNNPLAVKNWQRAFFLSMVFNAVLIGVNAYVSSLPRVEPVWVEVDKLGRTMVVDAGVRNAPVPVNDLIDREVRDWIEACRKVTSDYTQNNGNLEYCFSRLEGAAKGYVREAFMSAAPELGTPTHKPNDVAEKMTVEPKVTLSMPITDGNQRNSWQVEWVETRRNLKGEKLDEVFWKANIQYELRRGATKEEVIANPVGLHIPSLSWAQVK